VSFESDSPPMRVQRKRTKGYRLPPNTVCVTRPGPFGNRFRSSRDVRGSNGRAVEAFRLYLRRRWTGLERELLKGGNDPVVVALAIAALEIRRDQLDEHLSKLRGRNLACYCVPGAPCHGDVLLSYVNGPEVKP
jgi:hypothetical protein